MLHELINCRDKVGKTPLHAAASGVKSEGTIETVDYLLKHGATKILNKPSSEEESVKKITLSYNMFRIPFPVIIFLHRKHLSAQLVSMVIMRQ